MSGFVRNRSADLYRSNRWHIANDEGQPLCGHQLVTRRQVQTATSEDQLRGHQDSICAACRKRQEGPKQSLRFTKAQALTLHRRAEDAAREAADGARPTPMLVGEPKDLIGSLLGTNDEIDFSRPVHVVNDGACGMAWVVISPGNCSFARRLQTLHDEGSARSIHPHYYGGLEVYRPGYDGQSYERGMEAARAYAAVLREAGIDAWPGGRLD